MFLSSSLSCWFYVVLLLCLVLFLNSVISIRFTYSIGVKLNIDSASSTLFQFFLPHFPDAPKWCIREQWISFLVMFCSKVYKNISLRMRLSSRRRPCDFYLQIYLLLSRLSSGHSPIRQNRFFFIVAWNCSILWYLTIL